MLCVRRFRFVAFALLFAAFSVRPAGAQTPEFVWIESERTQSVSAKSEASGWGRKEFLSGEKWFQINLDENAVEKTISDEGVLIRYTVSAPSAGKYDIWNRVGYEFVRSPFDWRLNGEAWKSVTPNDLTMDLMAIDRWVEVAWIKMGDADLTAGANALEIRLPKRKDDKGKTQRILYASDALCLVKGSFVPNGKFKPNEEGRAAADRAAEKKVFALPEAKADGARTTITLNGDWEVCRNDEQTPPFDVAVPMQDFPQHPVWRAIAVPSDKNVSRPDLIFAHRLWYRTRINVPASHANRSFFLTFPRNNLNTTVYVNGVYCGFEKNPNVRFQIDITKGVNPGQINEIQVGIRDAWYGRSTNPKDPMKLRKTFNLPVDFYGQGFQDLAYPIWNAAQSGIVQTPTLTSAGGVYVSDVFIKPNVAKRELVAEITLTNATDLRQKGNVRIEAIDLKTGERRGGRSPQTSAFLPGRSRS